MTPERTMHKASVRDLSLWQRAKSRLRHLNSGFWTLYASSFLIDLGLCLYLFMFSLFLVEHHFTERAIGYITAALTIGTLAGTVPSSLLAKRLGLRTMLVVYIIAVPLCFASRVFLLQMPAQLWLAFLSGIAMSIWSVCFSPTLAKLTTHENRAFGFSIFVATGIGASALAGLLGGYLPDQFRRLFQAGSQVDGIRVVLLLACIILAFALFTILRLHLRLDENAQTSGKVFSGFLLRFLVAIAVWNFAINFFTPFANVYLSRHLGLPVTRIGGIFSSSQLIQVAVILMAPLLYRRVGLVTGLAITQLATASLFWGLSRASGLTIAPYIYLLLASVQWTAGPGIASLLMNRTPEKHRSQAAAIQNIVNLATQAGSAALAGKLFEQYGYSGPLAANAGIAVLAAVLLYTLLGRNNRNHRVAQTILMESSEVRP
jgi:MFS family permease